MSARRRLTYQRLLQWYPRGWRQVHGQVMIDTLEEHADARGVLRPTVGEAWSLRAHGIAERVTHTSIIVGASTALLVGLVPVMVLSGVGGFTSVAQTVSVTSQFLGALMTTLAAGALLLRAGVIRAETALAAGIAAVPAWVLAGLAAASWSVGFDEADAGTAPSWFGQAAGVIFLAALTAGVAALLPLVSSILRTVQPPLLRTVLFVLIAVPGAVALGISAVVPAGIVLGAAAVLIAASFQGRGRVIRSEPVNRTSAVLPPARRRRLATVTATTALLGAACVLFALTGSSLAPAVGDSTQAMRIGLLAGALIAIVTTGAAAWALFPRVGRAVLLPAAALIMALLALAASYLADPNSPAGWPLLLTAAALTGIAGGLSLSPVLPGSSKLRVMLIAAISVATAASVGLMVITTAAFSAPIVSAVLTFLLLRQPRQSSNLQTA